MSEKLTIKEISDVGEMNPESPEQTRLNGATVLEVFNSEEAGIEEPTEETTWDTFQGEEDEGKSANRVVVVPSELAEELEAA